MLKSVTSTLALALFLGLSPAAQAASQLELQARDALRHLGFDEDISRLTNHQLSAIYTAAHTERSIGERRRAVQSVLNRTPGTCAGLPMLLGNCGN